MTIIQMQYFQAVCKFENFTKAAEDQHISQPAMSAAMKDLEAECGVPLFQKTRNSLVITEAGWALLEEIQANLSQYDHLMHAVKDLSLSRKYVRVGVSTFNGNLVYPDVLSAFSRLHPDIQVISSEEATSRQFELMSQGKLDLAINGRTSHSDGEDLVMDSFYSWPMAENAMMFCVSRDHPLSGAGQVSWEQMAQTPLVLVDKSYGLTRNLLRCFQERDLECHVLHYTSQMYSVERFVEQGAACGFLPRAVVEKNPHIVGLTYPDLFSGQVCLWWRKGQNLYSSTQAFIDLVKRMYPKKA